MSNRPPFRVKSLPVYGINDYGHDVFIPIKDTLSTTDLTVSTSTITESTESGNVPVDAQDEVISDIDTLPFYNEGDDTEFDQTYSWHPDMSALVYKVRFNIAFALNVSARSAGSFDMTQIRVVVTEATRPRTIADFPHTVTMSAISSVDSAYYIMDIDFLEPFKVFSGQRIDFRFVTTVSTGTGTFQTGILPLFCYTEEAGAKPFTRSGIYMHIHASLDHADPVIREDPDRIV